MRTGRILVVLPLVILLCYAGHASAAESAKTADESAEVVYFIDFSDYEQGSIEAWLKEKGFELERDARDRRRIDLDVGEDGLILEAKRASFGILPNEAVDLQVFRTIRLEWGIMNYPEGASWEKGVRSEAIMVIVFFGYEKMPSGHFLIPNAPYFIGFFLSRDETAGKGFVGRYFKKSGRYVCLGNPRPGSTVVSEYDLVSAFRKEYKKDEVPHISGIAIAVDTSAPGCGGRSAAFIKSIQFLK